MKKIIVYTSLILLLVCLPTTIRGQYVKREDMAQVTSAVILYNDGVFFGGIWELGRKFTDSKTGATIRHTVTAGNGGNLNVNSKLPFRILIAPTDVVGDCTWAEAMGFGAGDNNNLEPSATDGSRQGGCATYAPPVGIDFPGYAGLTTGWRLPTQRELQLMWLFRESIDNAFAIQYPKRHKLTGNYWSSTEKSAGQAWYFGFDIPEGKGVSKTNVYKVRCVRDY